MTENKYELLSPAGDFPCLEAAVKGGADAVYIGEKSFSARKNAKNFSWGEIKEAVSYCHEYGVKLYLALNTLMKESERSLVAAAIENAGKNGVDGLIIQDLGVAHMARSLCPSLPRHASTQLTAHSAEDVEFLSALGFSRVVLSRELGRDEIKNIHDKTDCEIEAFVHGALCISFSGRCLMSSFIGGRSGNRGCCAQPCRQKYFSCGKEGYFLSPRDLSLCGKIQEMKDAGVMSFKIEGRMKSPEYVAAVTAVCRKALDGIVPTAEDTELLRQIFSRGGSFTEGYFSGINTPDIMNYSISNDNLSASVSKEAIARAHEISRRSSGRVQLSCSLTVREGQPISLSARDKDGNEAFTQGELPQSAQKNPLTAQKAKESIGKTGGTPYILAELSTHIDDSLFVPAAELNALRRSCFEKLSEKRREIIPKAIIPRDILHAEGIIRNNETAVSRKEAASPLIIAFVRNLNQLNAAMNADKTVVPLELIDKLDSINGLDFRLPQIILDHEKVQSRLRRIPKGAAVYSSTLGGLRLIKEAGLTPKGDYGLNIYNSLSARILSSEAGTLTLSPELSLKEIEDILSVSAFKGEISVYGRQEVMISRACLIRGVRGRCDCDEPLLLKDKTGAEFPILGDKETHLNTVLNSRPTYMADKGAALLRCGAEALQLRFTLEGAEDIKRIIEEYRRGGTPPKEFTRGYFFSKI